MRSAALPRLLVVRNWCRGYEPLVMQDIPIPNGGSTHPAMLERHLREMAENLRTGLTNKIRDAIQQSIAHSLVGSDGSLATR